MSFLVSVYNYPILSLDKLIVKSYIALGIQLRETAVPRNNCSPFGLLSMSLYNNCSGTMAMHDLALEPWSVIVLDAVKTGGGPGVKHRVNYS